MRGKQQVKERNLDLLFLENYPVRSRFAEAYRTLRTNIVFSEMDRDIHDILVTSAAEEEGKTLTVANLAHTMAQSGKTVVMVDADLRKPFLSRLSRGPGSPGVTGILSGLFSTDVRKGKIGEMGVGDLVELLIMQKKTGTLRLEKNGDRFSLFFYLGELVDCEWETCPDDKRLGSLLVQSGRITEAQARFARGRREETGQKIGFVLVNMGAIAMEDLSGVLTNYFSQVLRFAISLETGSYSFQEAAREGVEVESFYAMDLYRIYRSLWRGREKHPYLKARIRAAVQEVEEGSLFLLPSGPMPPNPSELLASPRMRFLLKKLKEIFDLVVIDSPPILPTSDAVVLAPLAGGVVFIVKAGKINRRLVRKAVDQLRRAKANILGVVLNQVDIHRGSYYYKYYEKYYSRYYGSEEK